MINNYIDREELYLESTAFLYRTNKFRMIDVLLTIVKNYRIA